MARVLLVDDEKQARSRYGDCLRAVGHEVTAVASVQQALEALARQPYDTVVTDLLLPGGDGMDVLRHTQERYPGIEVVVLGGQDKVAPEVLQHAVHRALALRELQRENAALRRHVSLLETGQRLCTTLDREQLADTARSAFQGLGLAREVVLFERDVSGRARLLAQNPSGEKREDPRLAFLAPHLDGTREVRELECVPGPWPRALVVPALNGDELLGHAALLYPGAPPEGITEATAFLARCMALALRNLGRISEVEDLAYLDDLTHLFNTRYLHLVLDRELKEAQQTHGVFSLLFLDLDYFKTVNDTHGHLVGSQLLMEMGRLLKGCVRDHDVVVRYGGDEYVVLLRHTDPAGAHKVAERIRRTVEQHRFLACEGYSLALSTCIGVASFPEHALEKATLLDLADRAMYRGKRGSRNVVYLAEKDLEATPPARYSQRTGS